MEEGQCLVLNSNFVGMIFHITLYRNISLSVNTASVLHILHFLTSLVAIYGPINY